MANEQKKLKIKLIKSINKKLASHKRSVRGLGLARIGEEVCLVQTPEILGMVKKVNYLLKVEEV